MNKIKNDKIFKHHCSQQIQCTVIVDKTAHSHTQVNKMYIYITILNININISLYIAITGINRF